MIIKPKKVGLDYFDRDELLLFLYFFSRFWEPFWKLVALRSCLCSANSSKVFEFRFKNIRDFRIKVFLSDL